MSEIEGCTEYGLEYNLPQGMKVLKMNCTVVQTAYPSY